MNNNKRMNNNINTVKDFLVKPEIHKKWINDYRNSDNEKFYNYVFDYLIDNIKPKKNSTILDFGCGTGVKSMHLAKRGLNVKGVDYSLDVLNKAILNVKSNKLENKISFSKEDITSISFKNNSFEYILCWGVLMHVEDCEKAISELSRILKPGGKIIISETNMHSFFRIFILPILRKLSISKKGNEKVTKYGIERWFKYSNDNLLAREADINFLIKQFKNNNIILSKRIAGQFTESYVKVKSRFLKVLIHSFNNFWFRYIKLPFLAEANILILKKSDII
tara:strand:- start:8847 stop:9683 length:837 start_codon:yes stop_codon:yes gene_type:complete